MVKSDFMATEVSSMGALLEFCEKGRQMFVEASERVSLVADDLSITVFNYCVAPPIVTETGRPTTGGGLGLSKGQARITAKRVTRPYRYASSCLYAAAGAMKVGARLAKTTLVPDLRPAPRRTARMFNVNG